MPQTQFELCACVYRIVNFIGLSFIVLYSDKAVTVVY